MQRLSPKLNCRSLPVSPWQSLRSSPAGQRQRGPLRSVSALHRTGQQAPDRSAWEGQSGDTLKAAILKVIYRLCRGFS